MTNSHNKIINQYRSASSPKGTVATPNCTDRFFNNKSPPFLNGGGGKSSYNKNKQQQQRSPSTKYFNSQPSSNICITPNKFQQQQRNNKTNGRSPLNSSASSSAVVILGSSPFANSPPNLTHFASSKCYDAPLPTSLPKPPHHWTMTQTCSQEAGKQGAKKFDIFSHNLKSILNVQA